MGGDVEAKRVIDSLLRSEPVPDSDEALIHLRGPRRPCTPGDEVAAPHTHDDGCVYAGEDHEAVAWPV